MSITEVLYIPYIILSRKNSEDEDNIYISEVTYVVYNITPEKSSEQESNILTVRALYTHDILQDFRASIEFIYY
jgi:hypothetical protein